MAFPAFGSDAHDRCGRVDAHYKRSVEAGARIVEELHETIYGERQYGVEDVDGHKWLFSRHVRDADPAEWGATVCERVELPGSSI
jgi:uncharacterized glyoxalase superfamily protein PhnB